jgi:hypothetical protein
VPTSAARSIIARKSWHVYPEPTVETTLSTYRGFLATVAGSPPLWARAQEALRLDLRYACYSRSPPVSVTEDALRAGEKEWFMLRLKDWLEFLKKNIPAQDLDSGFAQASQDHGVKLYD